MNSRYAWSTFLTLAFVVVLACDAMADTYYSTSNGKWSTNSELGPDCGTCSPADFNGQGLIIKVYHNIALNSIDIKDGYELRIYSGTLTVNGNLTLRQGSIVRVDEGAGLVVTGDFENQNKSNNVIFDGAVTVGGAFKNGDGNGSGALNAIIVLGPNGTLSVNQSNCSNTGQVVQNGVSYSGCNTGPLPVQLISFQAVQLGTDVQLTWATASEKGFQYFGIERADEELNWAEIGQVQGSGDSKVRIDYSYTDKALVTVGKTYYRLKAVDFDGYTEYFKVAYIDYRAPKAWAVTPNPAQDGHIVLTRNFSDDQPVVATVHSISGAQLFSEQVSFVSNKYTFDTNLKPGMYVLTLKTSNNTNHLRVIVE